MAAEHELTPLLHRPSPQLPSAPGGRRPVWTLNVDSLATAALLGVVSLGFLWWVVRGATSGVPNKRQASSRSSSNSSTTRRRTSSTATAGLSRPRRSPLAVGAAHERHGFLPVDIVAWVTHFSRRTDSASFHRGRQHDFRAGAFGVALDDLLLDRGEGLGGGSTSSSARPSARTCCCGCESPLQPGRVHLQALSHSLRLSATCTRARSSFSCCG